MNVIIRFFLGDPKSLGIEGYSADEISKQLGLANKNVEERAKYSKLVANILHTAADPNTESKST